MLKNISDLGRSLDKIELKTINGGNPGPCNYCFCHPTKGPGPGSNCCCVNL